MNRKQSFKYLHVSCLTLALENGILQLYQQPINSGPINSLLATEKESGVKKLLEDNDAADIQMKIQRSPRFFTLRDYVVCTCSI